MTIELTESPTEILLTYPELTNLVTFYSRLSLAGADPFQNYHRKWVLLLPEHSEEGWEEATEVCFHNVISTADQFIQFKFIHHLHYTPAKLSRMGLGSAVVCSRCRLADADLLHMF